MLYQFPVSPHTEVANFKVINVTNEINFPGRTTNHLSEF